MSDPLRPTFPGVTFPGVTFPGATFPGAPDPAPSDSPRARGSALPGGTRIHMVPGGTSPAQVAELFQAISSLLATSLPATAPGSADTRRTSDDAEGHGAPAASPSQPSAPSTLLVPVAPGEDLAALRERLERVQAQGVPPSADLILRTSGSSSGRGSLVAMSVAALISSARATYARLDGPGRWVLALPAHHVAGLQVLVRSALAGYPPVVVDTHAGFSTQALAEGLEEVLSQRGPAPVYTSLVPTQLLRCLEDPRAVAALARAAAVLVGGAATDPALYERALAAGLRVVRTYGMSETGGGCVYDGLPLDGVSVRLLDPDDDGVGRIVLAGPVLAEACWEGSSLLRPGPDGRVELLTSDRGRLDDGVLTVLGRLDDVIVTGGVKVEPRVVEEAVASLAGVAQCCVVAVPDAQWGAAVVAVVVASPGQSLDAEGLRAAARARLDGAHAPKHVLVVDRLAERGPGKVNRRAVAALARARLVG